MLKRFVMLAGVSLALAACQDPRQQSVTSTRHLAPIPPAWESLDDTELAALARQATPLTVVESGYQQGAPGADLPPRTDRTTR